MEGVLEEADEQQDDTLPETPSDAATSRRARLAALSNRMKKEFGHSSDITLDGENWLKNLHPWHKRILFKPESPNESPSESSNGSGSPSRLPNNADHNIESTPSTSKFESPQMIESVSRRARLAALTNRMRKEFDNVPEAPTDENDSMTRSLQPFYRRASSRPETPEPSKASQEMINPPPSEPPPPLPAMELRSPPPLPPRNPSIQLPMPSPIEQLTSEKASEASTASGSRQTSINSAESVNTKNEDNSCAKTEEIVQRKRGHMKTLSLDRDFNFAKSLRSSPFPPTSNKSNSLTRQAGAEQEEELRIIEAEGVINEITSDLQISEKEILNSAIPCPLNYVAANGCNILEKPKTILEKVDEGKTPESDLESPVKKIELNVESSASLPITDHLLTLSSSPKAPLDPISRDVERRLSMKFDRSLIKELPDDSLSGHSSIRSSSIDHAKVLARTASNYASSIFRGAINKVKQVAHTGSHSSNENDDETTDSDGDHSEAGSTTTNAVVRPRKTKKGPFDFQHLKIVQEINNEHSGPVWCIKFSACGRLLATAGADCVLRVWCLTTHVQHFQGMRERYQHKMDYDAEFSKKEQWETFEAPSSSSNNPDGVDPDPMPIFASKPFASYKGHVADILDLSWSKNYFILSSGMDRTAKLWHISRNECLCCFQHQDFVTSVSFLPKDDRYFVSGSLDGRMRIWNIPEKKVVFWNEVEEKLITALTFVKNGKFIVVGTYYGKCYFYTSELKYHTVISTRGRSSMGNKVTGLSVHGDKLLVTFNDSRIHMYDIRDKVLICKFRGAQHERSQIRASFSPDGRHVVSGSEDKFIYLWRTSDAQATRRDRNTMWERVRAHKTTVTVALFAPDPQLFLSNTEKRKGPQPNTNVIASADLDGSIKVMLNRATPKETLTNLPLEPVPEVDAPLTDNRANSLPKRYLTAMHYTHAILARIPEKLKTEKKVKLNIEGMRKQQEDLAETLRESGVKIIDIDTAEGSSAAALMVDNAAIMIEGTALIAQPKDEGINLGEIAKILAGLSWNVVECPPLLNGKPVILHGSDVLYTGKEIFVGIRKHATNMEGAICLGGVFCDIPVIPIHMHEKAHPLKYYVSIAGPQILAIGKGKEAQYILRTMEQEATFMYQIISVEDEEAVASLCVNKRTIFRQDRTDPNFTNLQRAGQQLWALDMGELVKEGQPFTSYCLLVRELDLHNGHSLKEI